MAAQNLSGIQVSLRPQCPQDWEPYKEAITEFYNAMELKGPNGVIVAMEREYSFKATENQYKKQFAKWGLDTKRIKAAEYGAIVRKKRQREGKESEILLRGEKVSIKNIERFEKRRRITEQHPLYNAATPPDLVLRTPSPQPAQTSDILLPVANSPSAETGYAFHPRYYYQSRLQNPPPSLFDPIVATLRLTSYELPISEADKGFHQIFSGLKVKHDCFGCRVVAFIESLAMQIKYKRMDREQFQIYVGCLIRYGIKVGDGEPGFLPGMSLNIGRYYAALSPSKLFDKHSITMGQTLENSDISRAEESPSDDTVLHCHVRKVQPAALLLKSLLGPAYAGALWAWNSTTRLDGGFCCRCREILLSIQTGFQEKIHKCPKCTQRPGHLLTYEPFLFRLNRNADPEFREMIRQRWSVFCAFILLGWSKGVAIVSPDEFDAGDMDQHWLGTSDIPCTKESSTCRVQCSWISLDDWII